MYGRARHFNIDLFVINVVIWVRGNFTFVVWYSNGLLKYHNMRNNLTTLINKRSLMSCPCILIYLSEIIIISYMLRSLHCNTPCSPKHRIRSTNSRRASKFKRMCYFCSLALGEFLYALGEPEKIALKINLYFHHSICWFYFCIIRILASCSQRISNSNIEQHLDVTKIVDVNSKYSGESSNKIIPTTIWEVNVKKNLSCWWGLIVRLPYDAYILIHK